MTTTSLKTTLVVTFSLFLWLSQTVSGQAATITIDSFETDQSVGQNTSSMTIVGGSPGILGPGGPGTGVRQVVTGMGNFVVIQGESANISTSPTDGFDVFMGWHLGGLAMAGYDLTDGGTNRALVLEGVEVAGTDIGDGIYEYSPFDITIAVGTDLAICTFSELCPAEEGTEGILTQSFFGLNEFEQKVTSESATISLGLLSFVFSDFGSFPFDDVDFVGLEISSDTDPSLSIGSISATAVVPIPAAFPLFLSGLIGLVVVGRMKRRQAVA
ncbi:MAG: VPLPA-CTERM sorting domain-containing protein [Proteobacteria bacterium]|nr:VPLPA-CTERM sorting domain-containing protein [Pseudomonadota bacterium]